MPRKPHLFVAIAFVLCLAAVSLARAQMPERRGRPPSTPPAGAGGAMPRARRVLDIDGRAGRWAWLKESDAGIELLQGGAGREPSAAATGSGWIEVALDGEGAWILQRGAGGGALLRVLLSGGAVERVREGLRNPSGLHVHEGRVYWVETTPPAAGASPAVPPLGAMARLQVREGGGPPRTLAAWPVSASMVPATDPGGPQVIGVGADGVYVAVPRLVTTELVRVPLSGGPPRLLASEEGAQQGVLSRGVLHWTAPSEEAGSGPAMSCVRRLGRGGAPETVTDWLEGSGTLVSTDREVFFAGDAIYRVPGELGPPERHPDTAFSMGQKAFWDGRSLVRYSESDAPSVVSGR